MARAIAQQIKLEGAEEIKQQFDALGVAGQQAFARIERSTAGLGASITGIATGFSRVGGSFGNVGNAARALISNVALLERRLLAAKATAGVLAAVLSRGVIANAREAQEALNDAAAAGVPFGAMEELKALGQVLGVDGAQLAKALAKLNGEISDIGDATATSLRQVGGFVELSAGHWVKVGSDAHKAAAGVGAAATEIGKFVDIGTGSMKRLVRVTAENKKELEETLKAQGKLTDGAKGLSEEVRAITELIPVDKIKAAGGDAIKLLELIRGAIGKLPSDSAAAQEAIKLLGQRLGPGLIPFLRASGDEIAELKEKFRQFGIGDADDLGDAQLGARFARLAATAGLGFDKLKSTFYDGVTKGLVEPFKKGLDKFASNHARFRDQLDALGQSVGVFVSDFTTVFAGLDTASVAPDNAWLIDLRQLLIDTGVVIKTVVDEIIVPKFQQIRAVADQAAGVFNDVFGTEVSGAALLLASGLLYIVGGFRLIFATVGLVSKAMQALWAVGRAAVYIFKVLGALRLAGLAGEVAAAGTAAATAATAATSAGAGFGLLGARIGAALAAAGRFLVLLARIVAWPLALLAGLALVGEYWDEVAAFGRAAWENIKKAASGLWDGVVTAARDAWAGVATVATDTWDAIKTAAGAVWEGSKQAAQDTWAGIKTIAADQIDGIAGVLSDIWGGVTDTAARAWTAIRQIAQDAFAGVQLVGADIWDGVTETARAAFTGIGTVLADVLDGIIATAGAVVDRLQPVWAAIRDGFAQAFASVAGGGQPSGAVTDATGLQKAFEDAKARIATIMQTEIPQAVGAGITSTYQLIQQFAALAADELGRIREAATQIFAGALGGAPAAATSTPAAPDAGLLQSLLQPVREAAAEIIELFRTELPSQISEGLALVSDAIVETVTTIQEGLDKVVEAARQMAAGLAQPIQSAATQIVGALQSLPSAMAAAAEQMAASANQAAASIVSAMQRIIDAANAAAAAMARVGSGGGGDRFARGGLALADGGHVLGPGTETSDSIPAWLSRGEFVVRAAAVRKYGLAVLHAINGMRWRPSRGAFNMPRFASGGAVLSAMTRTAGTSRASEAMRPFNLVIDNRVFPGMLAPETVAAKLGQYASQRSARSAGRSPSWS